MAEQGVLDQFGVKIDLLWDKAKAQEAQAAIKRIAGDLRSLAFEAAGAAAAIFAIGNNFTSNARSLSDQADMLGLSTKKLQEYEYAAKVAADVNRDELAGSLQHLGDMMDRARAGDQDARQALLQLAHAGIGEAEMLKKLNDKTYDSADAMRDLSLGFQNIAKQSPQAATRLAEFAFGNAKLIPLLRQGPKALDALTTEADKNYVLSEKMIRQGKEMDQTMSRIWLQFRNIGYQIGFGVMKHLGPLIAQFQKWLALNKGLIISGINKFFDKLVPILIALFKAGVEVTSMVSNLVDKMGGLEIVLPAVITGFLGFKALFFLKDLFLVLGPVLSGLFTALGALKNLKDVFMIFTLLKDLKTLRDVIAIFQLLGGSIVAAFAPLMAWAAAIAAAVTAIHDLWKVYQQWQSEGGKFDFASLGSAFKNADTWTGAGISKIKGFIGGGDEKANATVNPSTGPGATVVHQENHVTTNNNIAVPPGTSATAAAGMISRATVDSHEKIKAKQDAMRRQAY